MELSLTAFVLMTLIVVITPGPTVLLALSNGSRFGLASAGYGIAGAAVSDCVLIASVALGLGTLLIASGFWFAVIKYIGVAYLVWVGVQMLRAPGKPETLPDQTVGKRPDNGLSIFRRSLFVAVTNPKGYLFFTAFLPQFLVLSEPLVPQYVKLGLFFVALDVAVMAIYAGLGARATRFINDSGAVWLDRSCGGLLVTLGGTLVFVRRNEL